MLFSLVHLVHSIKWPKCRSKNSALNTVGRKRNLINRGMCLLQDEHVLNAVWGGVCLCIDMPRRKILAALLSVY